MSFVASARVEQSGKTRLRSWAAALVATAIGLAQANAQSAEPVDTGEAGDMGDAAPDNASLTENVPDGGIIARIRFDGLKRTRENVVRRELLLRTGGPFSQAALGESLQRLLNLRLFAEAKADVIPLPDGRVEVAIRVVEKWTTIPIARFGGGGGTNFIIAGLYDINTLGRYLEVGAQYENLGGVHSGVAWFRDPRFLNKFLLLGGDVWRVARVRRLYNADGEQEGAFTLRRTKLNVFSEREAKRWLFFGGAAEYNGDTFSSDGLNDRDREINLAEGYMLPAAQRTVLLRGWLRLGRLNWKDYLVSGQQASLTAEHAEPWLGSSERFERAVLDVNAAWLPWGTLNLAARFTGGAMTTAAPQHQFYLGGLDALRGFADGEVRGQNFWQLNTEARISSLATRAIVLQHVAFMDVGDARDQWQDFGKRAPRVGLGSGIRIASPKVYRLVLRLDYAFAFGAQLRHGLSFGVQQFF